MKRKIILIMLLGDLAVSLSFCSSREIAELEVVSQENEFIEFAQDEHLSESNINEELFVDVIDDITPPVEIDDKLNKNSNEDNNTPNDTNENSLQASEDKTEFANEEPIEKEPEVTPAPQATSAPETATPPSPLPTPAPAPQPITEAIPAPEVAFDVNYWVDFAKNYAVIIGLNLDSNETGSWDTPIGANAKCIYLERDITGRLDWYKNDYGFESVWIWAEEISAGSYNIYISYS